MNSITQDLMFRQSVIKYSLKYGVTSGLSTISNRWNIDLNGTIAI